MTSLTFGPRPPPLSHTQSHRQSLHYDIRTSDGAIDARARARETERARDKTMSDETDNSIERPPAIAVAAVDNDD